MPGNCWKLPESGPKSGSGNLELYSVGGFAARQALMFMRAPNYFEDPVQVELARAVARGDEARILQAIEDGADVN